MNIVVIAPLRAEQLARISSIDPRVEVQPAWELFGPELVHDWPAQTVEWYLPARFPSLPDGDAERAERDALRSYGHLLGQAFQIADDLLDVEADAATVGKATRKDSQKGKATLVGRWGVEAARARLSGLVAEAETALSRFGDKAETLRQAARFVAERRS